ncbi:hypothetical protein CRH01_33350 [Chryseobacterium rhizosphaerae]|nr:hypothetical protein CRH01_33350 [Chryseobacterium rhizosphaerae]
MLLSIFLSQGLYGQCSDIVNPSNGPQTFNGVTVSQAARSGAIYSQPPQSIAGQYYCDQSLAPNGNLLHFGGSVYNNQTFTPANPNYSYTFNFDKPVNNVVFNIWAIHSGESHIVSTNVGTVSLISECNSGTAVITGTTITSTAPNTPNAIGSKARIRISSTTPFTQLTFSGRGTPSPEPLLPPIYWATNGSFVNLCSGSITPAVAPTISGITPSTQTRCYNTPAQAITVSTTGATSYQWWVNTVNSQTGATSIPGATSASYTPPNNSPVGTLYYYAVATNSTGSTTSPIVSVVTQNCITTCYKPGAVATAGNPALVTKMGISSLTRTSGQVTDNWPAVRKGGWLVLEAKTKGFVPNRMAFDSSGNPVGIAAADFVEGMLVYDTTNKCLKMYTSKDGGTTLGWYCMTTQTCPD